MFRTIHWRNEHVKRFHLHLLKDEQTNE